MRFAKFSALGGSCWNTSMRAVVAAALCTLMIDQPLLAASKNKKMEAASASAQLQGNERVLHALNRLTFGPRPGDVAAVQRMGLERWFEQQLNPGKIDDSALEARLDEFPAMRLSQAQLEERFPSPQVLRQMIRRDDPLPTDPVEHAVYADQIAFYKMAQARKEAANTATASNSSAAMNDAAGQAMAADAAQTAPAKPKGKGRGVDLLGEGGMKAQDTASMNEEAGRIALMGDAGDPMAQPTQTHQENFYSSTDAERILSLPPDQRVKRILAMQPQELIDFRRSLSRKELAAAAQDLSPQQRELFASLQSSPRLIGAEVLETRLLRDIYSDRQLEAVMTDFWLNHFNVYLRKNQNEPYFLPAYERDVIAPHALGKFEDLLVATAKSPAMLMYLDNWQSIGPDSLAAERSGRAAMFARKPQVKQALKDRGINENYARELMELHTLGVQCEVSKDRAVSELPPACGTGYTQQDVTQVARVLTGWTIDRPAQGGEYRFDERRHEPGSKQVLGRSIHEGGEKEGLTVLHMLATSPATAQFICNKLAIRFVSDTPPPTLVDRMASSFLASDGDIKTVLRTMFHSPEFWSPEVYRAKVKTPLEFVVSAVRASDAEVTNPLPLVQSLDRLGMPLYGMQTPNGYNWTSEPWVSSSALVTRMNFALVLSGNRLAGTSTNWTDMIANRGTPSAQPVSYPEPGSDSADAVVASKERKLEEFLMGQPVSDRTRQTVLKEADDQIAQREAEKNFTIQAADPTMAAKQVPGRMMRLQQSGTQGSALNPTDPQAAAMAGLLLGSPEFQRR